MSASDGTGPPAPMTGTLVLAGTPLGNPGDASARLREALATATVIAAEDTRRLRRLATDLGVPLAGHLVSYFEGNEQRRTPELLETLRSGSDVLLVTDGGMPSVSDPGYRLVAGAVVEGIAVTVLPGPSAVVTALAVSGLPVDRFCFEGFLPRKSGERAARLRELAADPRTLVFFEAPHRLPACLDALVTVFGADRGAAVCRELTKTYEEVRRGPLSELAEWARDGVRGEVTVVVAGAPPVATAEPEVDDLVAAVAEYERGGMSRKDAIAAVAIDLGLPRRGVYNAVVASGAEREEPG